MPQNCVKKDCQTIFLVFHKYFCDLQHLKKKTWINQTALSIEYRFFTPLIVSYLWSGNMIFIKLLKCFDLNTFTSKTGNNKIRFHLRLNITNLSRSTRGPTLNSSPSIYFSVFTLVIFKNFEDVVVNSGSRKCLIWTNGVSVTKVYNMASLIQYSVLNGWHFNRIHFYLLLDRHLSCVNISPCDVWLFNQLNVV